MANNKFIEIKKSNYTNRAVCVEDILDGEFFEGIVSQNLFIKISKIKGYNAYCITTNEFHNFEEGAECVRVTDVKLTYKKVMR